MAISQVTSDINNTQTAKNLNVSRRIVNDWGRKFYDQGLADIDQTLRQFFRFYTVSTHDLQ